MMTPHMRQWRKRLLREMDRCECPREEQLLRLVLWYGTENDELHVLVEQQARALISLGADPRGGDAEREP